MTWVRLDDGFPDHPKVLKAGPLAGWLHVCGLAYANRHLTDGFVPTEAVPSLAHFEGVCVERPQGLLSSIRSPVGPNELAQTLVDVGLWEPILGGFRIHDYLEYNPSRREVLSAREAESQRRRAGGRARASTASRDGIGRFLADDRSGYESAGHRQDAQESSSPDPTRPDPVQDKPSSASLVVENRAGQALDGEIPDSDCRYLLSTLAQRSRSWAQLTENATQLEVVRQLTERHRSLVLSALRQAVDKTDQRKPAAWLRRVVEQTAAHEPEEVTA